MGLVSKRHKSEEHLSNCSDNELTDRLSSLPDEILVNILSFLPTKYAVGTCILSRRWERLWTCVPNLDFNQELLFHPERLSFEEDSFDCDEQKKSQYHTNMVLNKVNFENFVDRVLHSYNLSCIRRFCLKAYDIDTSYLTEWVSFAIRRHVEELEINVLKCMPFDNPCLDLPSSLFTCRNLAVLKLECKLEVTIPDLISFPNLKILHISLLHPKEDLMQKLSCGSLEELLINMCVNELTLIVSAPALKRLSICLTTNCHGFYDHNIGVMAPNLEYLTLVDEYCPSFSLRDSVDESLIKAFVNVGIKDVMLDFSNNYTVTCVHGLLREISGVEILSLSASTLAVLNYGDVNNLPIFNNLAGLRLDVAQCCYLRLLPHLLKSSPNLKDLCLNRDTFYHPTCFKKTFDLILPHRVPNCLLFQLKSIEFANCLGDKDELKVIKYLLKNARVLKKMMFLFKGLGSKAKKRFLARTFMSPKASRMCRVSELVTIFDSQCFKWKSSEIRNYHFGYEDGLDVD